jgi:PAS domain S-box-containing protein
MNDSNAPKNAPFFAGITHAGITNGIPIQSPEDGVPLAAAAPERPNDGSSTKNDFTRSLIDLRKSQEESYHRLLELEVLYETAPVGLGFLDQDLRYVRLNQSLAEINGCSIEDHLGRLAIEINPPVAKILVPMMSQVLALRQSWHDAEISVRSRSDPARERTWMVSLYPVANGHIFGVSVAFQEITSVRLSEDTKRRFSLIVESSDDAMVSLDLHTAITGWNRAAEVMFAYSAKEIMGKSISILAVPGHENELASTLERFHKGERAGQYETVYRCKNGRHIDVWLTVSLILMACRG